MHSFIFKVRFYLNLYSGHSTNSQNFNFRCDCKFDCTFGEDEEGCQSCSEALFRCPGELRFINMTWVCDGLPDCTSGADELPAVCPNPTTTPKPGSIFTECTPEEFECSSGQCIPFNLICDEYRHCADGTDEGPKCRKLIIFNLFRFLLTYVFFGCLFFF